jgi:hypothetical protein
MGSMRFVSTLLVLTLVTGGPLAAPAAAQSSQPTPAQTGERLEKSPEGEAAAVMSNLVYVPGKAITCVAGATLSFVALLVTLGTLNKEATRAANGACGGKWVIEGTEMTEVLREQDRPY